MHASTYAAQGFHTSLEQGRASGDLTVSPGAFRFRSGAREVSLPLSGAELRLGGASDRLLFISHPGCPGWSVYTSDLSIFKDPALAAHPAMARFAASARQRRLFNWVVAIAVLALLVALPVLLVMNAGALAGIAANRIPVEWEKKLGDMAYAQFQLEHTMLDEADAQARLDTLTRALTSRIEAPRHTFTFHIASDPTLNAFALPGGTIVIHSGLILRAANASELQGVLAHEVAHVTEQHGLRNIIASAGLILTAQAVLGDVGGLLGTLAAAAPFLLSQQYSRKFEDDADTLGFALLERARIDGRGLVSFFERIKAEEEKAREKMKETTSTETAVLLETLSGFVSSHPATNDRIARIRDLASRQQGPYQNLDADFLALQAAVRTFVAAAPGSDHEGEKTDGNPD